MTIVLNGTTGITNDGGYTGDGISFADTTPANTLVTTTGGNVGIGTSNPTARLDVNGTGRFTQQIAPSSGVGLEVLYDTINSIGVLQTYDRGASAYRQTTIDGSVLRFNTNGSERMRIDSSGNLLVGTTTASNSCRAVVKGGNGTQLTLDNAGEVYTQLYFNNNGTSKADFYFENSTTRLYARCNNSGGVYLGSGATSWTSASDERVKDIIEPITNGAEKVSSLRAVIGKYKTDEEGKRRAFLIAQDVQAVLPEAVDATDPEQLGVAYSDVIPLLVSAIQEQQAIITDLKSRIETLEAK
jgi:hypothetical protein